MNRSSHGVTAPLRGALAILPKHVAGFDESGSSERFRSLPFKHRVAVQGANHE